MFQSEYVKAINPPSKYRKKPALPSTTRGYMDRWTREEYDEWLSRVQNTIDRLTSGGSLNTQLEIMQSSFNTSVAERGMGVDSLASQVRELGYSCQVVHHMQYATEDDIKNIIYKFVGEETLLVGFSQTFLIEDYSPHSLIHSNAWIAGRQHMLKEWIKGINPNTYMVLGGAQGNHAKELFEDDPTARQDTPLSDIEIFNHGWGDVTILEMLQDIEAGTPKRHYVDRLSKLDIQNSVTFYEPEDLMCGEQTSGIEIGRGCIFKCKFCNFSLTGKEKGTYIKHTSCIETELVNNWERFGTYKYWITDDTFNDDTNKIERIAEVVQKYNIPAEFTAYLRLDLLNRFHDSQVPLLKNMGLKHAFLGIESLNPDSASLIGKGWNPDEQMAYIRYLKNPDNEWDGNVLLTGSFIYGLPDDSKESLTYMHDKLTDLEYNHLDFMALIPLYLSGLRRFDKSYTESDLGVQWKEYGYTVVNDEIESLLGKGSYYSLSEEEFSPTYWVNKHGISFNYANALSARTKARWVKKKYPGKILEQHTRQFYTDSVNFRKNYLKKLLDIKGHIK